MIATRKRAPRIEDLIGAPIPPQRTDAPTLDDGALPRPELERLDRRLAELGRASGRWRLQLGELLEHFTRRAGPTHFGFPSTGAYGGEHTGRTPRWCDDSRALARRLEHLPLLRASLASGALGWSMVELLARHATPDTEAQLLLAARDNTVRAMKALLAAPADTLPPDRDRSTIETTVPLDDAWAWEFVRILLDRGLGCRGGDESIEAMLAEASLTLSLLDPDLEVPLGPPEDPAAPWRNEQAERDAKIEADLEHRVDIRLDATLGPLPAMASLSDDIHVLHQQLCELALEFASRDFELGHTTIRFFKADGWRKLGFTSDTQYARERVGCSLRSLQQRMRLARGVDEMPAVHAALLDGTIGFESALLILRRSRPRFAEAWVERARHRTVLDLRDELDIAGALARVNATAAYLAPPSDGDVVGFQKKRAQVLSGAVFVEPSPEEFSQVESQTQISGDEPPKPGTGMRTLRLTMEHDLARWWRRLEKDWRLANCANALGSTFVEFLCGATAGAWQATVHDAQRVKYANIYARDGYRCTNPVCNRRDVTPHHLTFRSRGGGEEDGNLVALCTRCHLDLLHGGFIRAEGPAGEIRWLLGRVPQLEVLGRAKVPQQHAA